MKNYTLEPDFGKYYIIEHSENYTRTALIVYYDIDLAKRILDILNNEQINDTN